MNILKKTLNLININNLFYSNKKEIPKNIWQESLPVLQSLDSKKYNCMTVVNGEMTYGWIESVGCLTSSTNGYNNIATGEKSINSN